MVSEPGDCFIRNLKKFTLHHFDEDPYNKGAAFYYEDGRKLAVKIFHYQVDVVAAIFDENNRKEYIDLNGFGDVGYDESDPEIHLPYDNNEYVIGQYDFDGDEVDEIIVGVRSRLEEGMNGVCPIVYRVKDKRTWCLHKGMDILGEAKVSLVNNRIKIERHLRDFCYEWAFEGDDFIEKGYPLF